MKNRLYKLLTISFCVLITAGCNFLEERSQDEKIPTSVNDFSEILMGRGYPWGNDNLIPCIYLLGDDIESFHETYTTLGSVAGYQAYRNVYTWQPDMYESPTIPSYMTGGSSYYSYYLRIGGCNTVLDMIDGAAGSVEKRERTKAEAYAVRAMHYFYLVNLYGEPYNVNKTGPGVPLKLTIGVEPNPIRRSTVEEVYAQIVKDLKAAIALFGKYEVTRGDNRINLPATYILLSRAYLHMEEWDNCIDAATEAIGLSRGLMDMRPNTTWTAIATYAFTETEWLYGKADYLTILSTAQYFVPSESQLSLYDMDNDSRYKSFFRSYTASSRTSILVNKNTHNISGSLGNSIRTAEAYINRAEAYARKNDPKAAADINAIRSNRIVGYSPVTSVTLEDVLVERRKELCYEVPRWFDLRRLGMPSIVHKWMNGTDVEIYTLKQGDPMYTLPIPPDPITNNKGLVQNKSRFSETRLPGA